MKLLFAYVSILLLSVATGQVADTSYVCDPGNLPPVDVMFILSSNHTMSNFEFQEKLQIVEEYVSKVNIGNNSVRVGVISEYEYSDVEFHLDDHMTKSELLRALPYIYYGQEGALAGEAFKYMSEEDLNVHLGGRPGVPDVVIFLTNSNTAGNNFAKNNSEKVQAMGATVIGLGVGDFHKLDLVNVASGCHYVDQSPNFTHSHTHLVGAALNLTCDALAGVPANECCELPTCCPNDVDVLFLLDASSLQSKANFEKQLFYADNMTQALHVSGNNSRVAAMTYSTHPHPQFTFDQHLNKTDLLQAIEFLPYQFGERHVEEGLKYVLAHDFLNNSRPGVQKVVFVTTTGPQQGENDKIPGYIAEMVNQGARVVSVGMGNTVIDTEVTIMATGANGNALVYNDFDAFLAGWKDGIRLVCEGEDTP